MKHVTTIAAYVVGILVLLFILLEQAGPGALRQRFRNNKRVVVVVTVILLIIILSVRLYLFVTR